MNSIRKIEINADIFPYVMKIALGRPLAKDSDVKNAHGIMPGMEVPNMEVPNIVIDLPRGANLLYLNKIATDHNELELRLLEQYAYGVLFSDADYEELLKLIMTPVNRNRTRIKQDDILTPFGIQVCTDDAGNQKFALIEEAIPVIRAETWECIIIDLLKQPISDIIACFDFSSSFTRKQQNNRDSEELQFDLGAWKFSSDISEQSLSNALRTALIFTLVSYCYGDTRNQYKSFSDFFDTEYYKRVSLVHGIWSNRGAKDTVEYIPLYESFHNLNGMAKSDLIDVLRAILDDSNIALDEKQTLKNRLIEGAGEFHSNINAADQALEQSLIKPAVNFILLREKAKETLTSAKIAARIQVINEHDITQEFLKKLSTF